jgi:hypothetical protein
MATIGHTLTRLLTRGLSKRLDATFPDSGPAVFSPADVSPLSWYDVAPAYCYVERTGGGTTLASVNGVVGTVRDRSGNAFHLQAPTDAARPLLRNSGALYWLEFDGVDDAMRAAFTVGTTFARYSAFASISYTGGERLYSGGSATQGELSQGVVSTEIRQFHTIFGLAATVPATGTNYTVSETITGTTGSLQVNAGSVVSSTGYTSNTPGGLTVGAFWNGAVHASYGNIKWFGCTMRASVFGAPELGNLETYYRSKAGL